MKKYLLLICLLTFVCALSFSSVWAAEVKKEQAAKMDAKQEAEFAKKVELFTGIATYAETNKDAIVMVSAIKMLDQLPFDGIVKPGQPEKDGARFDRATMVKQAKEYAAGDAETLAVIAKVQDVPKKIDVRGYYYYRYVCYWYSVCGYYGCRWVCR
jgi:hypothetical protein